MEQWQGGIQSQSAYGLGLLFPSLRDRIMKPYWQQASTHYLGKGLDHGLYIDIITQVQQSYTKNMTNGPEALVEHDGGRGGDKTASI